MIFGKKAVVLLPGRTRAWKNREAFKHPVSKSASLSQADLKERRDQAKVERDERRKQAKATMRSGKASRIGIDSRR